jgi:DNA-binding SARP family transcriptional activator
MHLKLYLFGAPRLEYQNQPVRVTRRKALALAAFLALAEQPHSREAVATLLWPELGQAQAHAALRSTLPALTRLSPRAVPAWLLVERATLAVDHQALWVDVNEFRRQAALSRGHGHGPEAACAECLPLLARAQALYDGEFMAGFSLADSTEFDNWQSLQRESLRRELAGFLRRVSEYFAGAGQVEPAIEQARRWLALDPLHEPAHRHLMRLYAASGQRTEALRQYRQCVELLEQELATPPEEETTALYAALQADTPLAPARAAGAAPASSLLPALPALIVGREAALDEIKRRVGLGGQPARPLTVIQGWPGVGKSTSVAALAHDGDVPRQFPDGVLWASLGEAPSLLGQLQVWAQALAVAEPGRARSLEELSTLLAARLRDRRMLLIVDDVWQVGHAQPFRIGGQGCATVMTTRLNEVAQALAPTAHDLYRLPVLSQAKSLELLTRLTPETVSEHPAEAAELVRDLEGLPLALQVAGRLLAAEGRLGWGVSDLLAELRSGANLLAAPIPGEGAAAGGASLATVAALLKRSTDSLEPAVRERFALLGLFAPKPATFGLEALAVAWDTSDPRPTARTLVARGLLEPISGGRFQTHALLVWHARSLLEALER